MATKNRQLVQSVHDLNLTMWAVTPCLKKWGLLVGMVVIPALLMAAKVTYLTQPAEIMVVGSAAWQTLSLGRTIGAGDQIRTGLGGRVEVTLQAGRSFRLAQATQVTVSQLAIDSQNWQAKIRVGFGRFWGSLVQQLQAAKGESFRVDTPTAVLGVKGTRFGVDVDQTTQGLQVSVVQGKVETRAPSAPGTVEEITGPQEISPPQEITQGEWLVVVEAMQRMVILPDGTRRVLPMTEEDLRDEWITFNNQRDQTQ